MCIIALKPEGFEISEETLRNMWENNDDGAGFMYADRGKVRVVKGLMTFEKFLDAYRRVGEHRKIVMHFRIRTHGTVSPELTHPFWIRKGTLAMVHNGIITATNHHNFSGESDTSLYAKVLAHRYPDPLDALTNQAEVDKIVSEIGWSKLVFLTGDNGHIIINEKSGEWVDGCWFSNSSHKKTYRSFHNWSSYSYFDDSESVWTGTRETSTGTSSGTFKAFTFGESSKSEEDAEWDALLARYESKYGHCSD
jgi:predicted glutamine amidotransferase